MLLRSPSSSRTQEEVETAERPDASCLLRWRFSHSACVGRSQAPSEPAPAEKPPVRPKNLSSRPAAVLRTASRGWSVRSAGPRTPCPFPASVFQPTSDGARSWDVDLLREKAPGSRGAEEEERELPRSERRICDRQRHRTTLCQPAEVAQGAATVPERPHGCSAVVEAACMHTGVDGGSPHGLLHTPFVRRKASPFSASSSRISATVGRPLMEI